MAEIQRRSTTAGELGHERNNRRKSGIFFFNRSFKKSASSPKGDNDSNDSAPTTPTLGPVQDGLDLKRSDSGRSIPALAQTSAVTVEAERALSSSPKTASISLGEAAQKSGSPAASITDSAVADAKATEDLPTPPDTPGPSSTDAAAGHENEQAELGSDSKSELPEVEKKFYSEDADLDIKVRDSRGGDAVYSVRSCVLESASRVWKQSLPSRESDTVDMVSDPSFGLDVIFSIAHYRFQDLPRPADVGELYGIAVAAEKYETVHLLTPFVKSWLSCLDSASQTAESQDKETLVAGWVLGEAQSFARTVARCAYNSSISSDGTLLDFQGKPWQEQPLSAEVLEFLAVVRLGAIEQIIQAVSSPVNALLNPQPGTEEPTRYCKASGDDSVREECEQLQLGSAIMGLTKAKLWPAPEPSRVQASPVELARTYGDVRLRRSVEDTHAQCGFGHQDQFARVLSQPAQLPPVVIEQLVSRAKQTGVYEEEAFKALEEGLVEESAAAVE